MYMVCKCNSGQRRLDIVPAKSAADSVSQGGFPLGRYPLREAPFRNWHQAVFGGAAPDRLKAPSRVFCGRSSPASSCTSRTSFLSRKANACYKGLEQVSPKLMCRNVMSVDADLPGLSFIRSIPSKGCFRLLGAFPTYKRTHCQLDVFANKFSEPLQRVSCFVVSQRTDAVQSIYSAPQHDSCTLDRSKKL